MEENTSRKTFYSHHKPIFPCQNDLPNYGAKRDNYHQAEEKKKIKNSPEEKE